MALDPLTLSPSWWLDASDASTLDLVDVSGVATVAQWRDKSGNGKHCYTATASKRPKYLAADPLAGGKPAVSARDATSILVTQDTSSAALLVQIAEIYMVIGAMTGVETTWTTANMWGTAGGADGYGGLMGAVGTQQRMLGNVNANTWNPGTQFNTKTLKNGSTVSSAAPLPMAFSAHRILCNVTVANLQRLLFNETTTTSRAWKGPMSEVLAFPTTLSSTDAAAVNQYLMDKWLAAPAITGTAAITEADDVAAAVGVLRIAGAATLAEAGDTAAATGRLAIRGAAAVIEAGDVAAAAGRLPIVAAAVLAEDGDTGEAVGVLPIVGALAAGEAGDTLAAAGLLTAPAGAIDPPTARTMAVPYSLSRVLAVPAQPRVMSVPAQSRILLCQP